MPLARDRRARVMRPVYFVAGVLLTGVGAAGLILPMVPGTVFLILAAACFARSSPRFEAWLLNHPQLGPNVVAWRETGAIAFRIKLVAIGAMALSAGAMWLSGAPLIAKGIASAAMAACAIYVGTRPGLPAK